MSDTPPPSNSSSGELSVPWPAFTMKYCKLPIELCWDIIDAIPSSLYFLSPCEHDTLVACKNVCTMWRTHAEAILMRIARLNSPQIVSQFVSAIRRESPGRMRVDSGYIPLLSLDWFSFEGDKNLSRAMDLFMSPLPSDTGLFMSGVRIEASPRVLRAMLDIVWGCPKLEVLSVWCYSFEGKTPTPESIARLGVARRSLRGCLYLKELCIYA
ncbi:hypothetical protein C8Q79DRAFT_333141 [Trametes meyenii]|nr:hypothetical protein C8Q79DRAFT_333141 [Trametes meyenii]